MVPAHATTPWASASLACGILGVAGLLATPALYALGLSRETTGVSASIGAGVIVLLSGSICLAAVICGTVALRKVRRHGYGGRARAWTGIFLGCLPVGLLLAWAVPVVWEELSIRLQGPVPGPGG
jgi:hypothetical protein